MTATKVLVVDDQHGIRNLIHRILTGAGFQVIDADCGEAALALAATNPDIVLAVIDVTMPQMDGPTLTVALREQWPELPVVLMSGFDMDDVLGSGPTLEPAPLFLEKPFTMSELLQTVQALLASGRSSAPHPRE